MALSNDQTFSLTRNNLIYRAMTLAGVYEEGQVPSAFEITEAQDFLNMLIKHWQADGLQLWMRREITVFLEKGKSSYDLGPNNDYATPDSDYTDDVTTAAAVSTDTTITVADSSIYTALDYIGIRLDDDTIHWTTIASIDTGTTMTITDQLTDDVASGNQVWSYTNRPWRPLQLMSAFRRDDNNNDIPMAIWSQDEYRQLGLKSTNGNVSAVHYDPQLTDGKLYVFNPESHNDYLLKCLMAKPYDVINTNNDDFEFPEEYFLALVYNLALLLCDTNKTPDNIYGRIQRRATMLKEELDEFDNENNVSMYVSPELEYER